MLPYTFPVRVVMNAFEATTLPVRVVADTVKALMVFDPKIWPYTPDVDEIVDALIVFVPATAPYKVTDPPASAVIVIFPAPAVNCCVEIVESLASINFPTPNKTFPVTERFDAIETFPPKTTFPRVVNDVAVFVN